MNQELLDRLRASPQLPTLPVIAIKILELTRREDVSVPEIADLIIKDPALASKILRTVNSPFYGMNKQVSTVSGALVILGLQAAKTLALGFSLLADLKSTSRGIKSGDDALFDQTAFWKRSICSAVAARALAHMLGIVQLEEAFLAGLLANMGALVLHRLMPDQFDPLCARSQGNIRTLNELCAQEIGVDPPAVSALLAETWQLPPLLARPIALHVSRQESDPVIKPLVEAVSAGVLVADVFVARGPADAIARTRATLKARLNLSPEQIESVLDQTGKSTREAAALFDLHIGAQPTYQEILDEAQQALVEISLRSQMEVKHIQKQIETLQVRATTDPLTGLANRARFDEFLEEHFRRAYTHARPLALVILDIDHFKNINDTHGHQTGDEVLRRVGKLLKASVRTIDLAARYGGEEFALVLTETDTADAAVRAEALRARLAAGKWTVGEISLELTLSAGVAGMDRSRIFSQPAQLTSAADRAAYAAKLAGRNTVRVFKPVIPCNIQNPLPTHRTIPARPPTNQP